MFSLTSYFSSINGNIDANAIIDDNGINGEDNIRQKLTYYFTLSIYLAIIHSPFNYCLLCC